MLWIQFLEKWKHSQNWRWRRMIKYMNIKGKVKEKEKEKCKSLEKEKVQNRCCSLQSTLQLCEDSNSEDATWYWNIYTGSLDCAVQTFKAGRPFKFYTEFPVYCVRIAPCVMMTWIFLNQFQKLEKSYDLSAMATYFAVESKLLALNSLLVVL